MSLFVKAAKPIQLPISIISGCILWSQPESSFTPLIFNKFEPIPEILPPMAFIILQSC